MRFVLLVIRTSLLQKKYTNNPRHDPMRRVQVSTTEVRGGLPYGTVFSGREHSAVRVRSPCVRRGQRE